MLHSLFAVDIINSIGWTPAIVALITTGLGGYFTYQASSKVARTNADLESKKIEGAAYDRAKTLLETGINGLQREIGRLEELVGRLRTQVVEYEDQRTKDRERIAELELRVTKLRRRLIIAGLEDPEKELAHEDQP